MMSLALMKPTAYVVNTSRGPMVDHEALADVLHTGCTVHEVMHLTLQHRLEVLLQRASLPTSPPESMDEQQFLQLMAVDKKVMDGGLRLVLLKGIGKAVVTGDFDPALLSQTLGKAA